LKQCQHAADHIQQRDQKRLQHLNIISIAINSMTPEEERELPTIASSLTTIARPGLMAELDSTSTGASKVNFNNAA
tara:strand:- start:462 stop:689 length:228 start_codon:yes stop_codon:yes gene_type:complete